jgi:hypothetical protein
MAKDIVRRLVVGFGFFNGVWFSIGISPEDEVLKFLQPMVSQMPDLIKTIFTLIPILLTIISIFTMILIYSRGGILGSAAVVLAFFAGAIIFKIPAISIILLVIAYILGIGVYMKNK